MERHENEIHDRIRNDMRTGQSWQTSARLIPALILIGLGALFLLNNLHLFPDVNLWSFWPLVLIVLGIVKLVEAGPNQSYGGGAALIAIGAVFLADNLGFLPIPVWNFWPVVLIAAGIGLLLDRIPWRDRFETLGVGRWGAAGNTYNSSNLTAVFSGGKRKFDGEDFKGAVVSTVFGGFELDLRRAIMTADSAVLQVDAVFGGCEIKIPENWNVTLRGGAVFGGYSDESHHPMAGMPGVKQLIVKGGAVFGGVVVKN